ncbi:MAG TPA: iron-sulfur cluster repair di-iron protein [Acidobacteriaceae bacterium]|nr:iron-sulfur cluster repair di-iron protein [Acidobacteriaceae bacterium]
MTTSETTVREIALEQPASIRVFEKFGIDYCCGGRRPLAAACEERSLDVDAVLAAIESATNTESAAEPEWVTAPLGEICKHIVEKHHAYVRNEVPRLRFLAQKVVTRHGPTHAELGEIQQTVEAVCADLLQHMDKEEMILFPYITNLEQNRKSCGPGSLECLGTVRNPIRVMMAEHDAAGAALARMRTLSGEFTAPEGACPTYRGFYQALEEFEQDLHRHVHLENNVLFPRTIELEESGG